MVVEGLVALRLVDLVVDELLLCSGAWASVETATVDDADACPTRGGVFSL